MTGLTTNGVATLAALALTLVCAGTAVTLMQSTRGTRRKAIAVSLNVGFAVALWLFLWPPTTDDRARRVVVVTPGADATDLARARRARHAVAVSGVALNDTQRRDIESLPDLASIAVRYGAVDDLVILGDGLPENEWPAERPWDVIHSPPPIRPGVRVANWPRELDAGATLRVTGALTASAPEGTTVRLLDPAGDAIDSVTLAPRGRFALSTATRANGHYRFALRVESPEGATLEQVPVPVTIRPAANMRILLLWSAPSFEARALKRWARQGGATLAARTAISRERFRQEFSGMPERSLATLDASTLAAFDTVVLDARSWSALNASEHRALSDAARDQGLGVLLVLAQYADLVDPDDTYPALARATRGPASLALDLTATVTRVDAAFVDAPNPLLMSGSGQTLAAYRSMGAGRFGLTLVDDSHQLVTSGRAPSHAQYWKTLLDGVFPGVPATSLQTAPTLPRAGKRMQLCLRGDELPNAVTIVTTEQAAARMALATHPWRPGERCGYWWPTRDGWHTLQAGTWSKAFYVHASDDWQAAYQGDAITATQWQTRIAPAPQAATAAMPGDGSRTGFALLALLCAAALWWEQKSRG